MRPSASTPCDWTTDFARSTQSVVISPVDGSRCCPCSQRPTWHIAMPEAGAIHASNRAPMGDHRLRRPAACQPRARPSGRALHEALVSCRRRASGVTPAPRQAAAVDPCAEDRAESWETARRVIQVVRERPDAPRGLACRPARRRVDPSCKPPQTRDGSSSMWRPWGSSTSITHRSGSVLRWRAMLASISGSGPVAICCQSRAPVFRS